MDKQYTIEEIEVMLVEFGLFRNRHEEDRPTHYYTNNKFLPKAEHMLRQLLARVKEADAVEGVLKRDVSILVTRPNEPIRLLRWTGKQWIVNSDLLRVGETTKHDSLSSALQSLIKE